MLTVPVYTSSDFYKSELVKALFLQQRIQVVNPITISYKNSNDPIGLNVANVQAGQAELIISQTIAL